MDGRLMLELALLFLLGVTPVPPLEWDPVTTDCTGAPETMGVYEVRAAICTSTPGVMRYAFNKPDDQSTWWVLDVVAHPVTSIPDPVGDPDLGESFWYDVEPIDAAGHRPTDPCD
jgi:hypothetical protein